MLKVNKNTLLLTQPANIVNYTFVIIQENRNIIFLKLGGKREVFNEHLNLERFFQVTVDSKSKEVEMAAFCAFRNAYGNDTKAYGNSKV